MTIQRKAPLVKPTDARLLPKRTAKTATQRFLEYCADWQAQLDKERAEMIKEQEAKFKRYA